jgi:hypothetical protein
MVNIAGAARTALARARETIENPPQIVTRTHTTIPGTPAVYDPYDSRRMIRTGSPSRPGPDKVTVRTDEGAVSAAEAALPDLEKNAAQLEAQLASANERLAALRQNVAISLKRGQESSSSLPALAVTNQAKAATNTPEAKAVKTDADLAGLQKQRAELIKQLADARNFLERAKSALAKTPLAKGQKFSYDSKQQVISGAPTAKVTSEIVFWTEDRGLVETGKETGKTKRKVWSMEDAKREGYVIVPNPDLPKCKEDVHFYQSQVSKGETALAELDKRISQFPPVGASDNQHKNPTATTPNPLFAAPPPPPKGYIPAEPSFSNAPAANRRVPVP